MLIDTVVINASPLIVLFKSQLGYLLPQLFTEILVPTGVWNEVVTSSTNDAASQQLPTVAWARLVEVSTVSPAIVAWNSGFRRIRSFKLCFESSWRSSNG